MNNLIPHSLHHKIMCEVSKQLEDQEAHGDILEDPLLQKVLTHTRGNKKHGIMK